MHTKTNKLALLGLFTVCFLFANQSNVNNVSAYSASITTNNSISLDVSPSGDGTSIHSESINIQSDCRAGYNLTIATPQGSNLYKYDNNTQSSSTASFTAVDGTSALNSNNNTNKWGYTLDSNPTSSTVFSPLSTTQSVLKTSSQTASTDADINDTFNINYGVKTDSTIAPGSYQMASNGAIVYYLTMDTTCTQYTVSFNPNGGTLASGTTNPEQGIQAGEPTKLDSSDSLKAPQGASYTDANSNTITGDSDKLWTFWGWNTAADGTGDWYKDREEVEDLTAAGSTITLYAQWKQATLADMITSTPVGTEKTIDHNEMQDMRPEVCYNSPITTAENAPAVTLIDKRGKVTTGDNPESPEQYTVSKLADGLCWMTTNLNLGRDSGGPNSDGTITLTSDNTDLAENTTFTVPVSTNSFLTANNTSSYTTPLLYKDSTYGVYYTWATALASTTNYSTSGTNVTTSICPRSWDLPTSYQYDNLKTKAGLTTSNAYSAPFNFYKAGYKNGTSAPTSTTAVYLWTSTSGGTRAYYSSATANATTTSYNKRMGYNIRCIASNGTVTINYDGNGTTEHPVTGSVASQSNVEINSTNTNANGFTRTGWAFSGWNTAADGTGISIAASAAIFNLNPTPGSTITLYAQWSPALTINFNSNGGTGTMTSQLIPENTSNALKSNSFTAPSGNYFIGWMTEESRATNTVIYANGATYTAPTTVTPGDSITLYAKWGPRYTIVYNGNNATGGSMISSGTELKYTNINEGTSVNLYAPNYWKTDYGFVGWSPSPTATVGGTDPIYGPNETISAPSYDTYGQEISGTKTITLYAIWLEADTTKTMQTFTTSDCQNLAQTTYDSTTGTITAPSGSVIALKDQRDNNVYTVARLADGNCWMTENLRLEAANTVGNNQYDSTITNQSLAQGYGGVFTGLDSTENSNFTNTTNATPNNLYNSTNITGSYTDYRFPRYNNNNTNTSLTASYSGTGSSTYYSWYSYGNYYTWAAAMANTTHYTATGASGSESASTSLCPTNWTLPLGGTQNLSGSFYFLNQQLGRNTSTQGSMEWRSFPNNFLYSGIFNGSSADSRGSNGYYWSRSANSYSNSYRLYLYYTSLNPSDASNKGSGSSVRCLVDNTYTIKYDGNGATGGSMISDGNELKHTGLLGGETIDLYPSNYYKTGYGFAGWSTDADAWTHFTDNDATNDPVIYGPMETITAPAHPGQRIMTLYAVWVPAAEDGNNNPVYLQDFDTTACSNLTSTTFDPTTEAITVNKNSIVALTDKRDGNVYTVARLADGNCWMTENLRLEAANTVGNNQYDSSVTNESLAQGYGGVFTGLDSTENANFIDTTTATPNNLYNSTNITGSYRFPRYNNNNTKTSLTASYNGTGSSTYYSWYSYGNYYTWAAAMANTTYYSSATGTSGSESAGTSICPTNWTLPTSGTTTKDFGTLSRSYDESGENQSGTGTGDIMSNRFRSFPNNFLYSGSFNNGSSAFVRGSGGYYWSRSAYSYSSSYSLYLGSTSLYPSSNYYKYYGHSVRCLIGS